eukprot:Skav236421  [mRNA]  locus=scaffold4816:19541:21465:- [translate_table: standard]
MCQLSSSKTAYELGVDDYLVSAEVAGVKDTAAIRVATTLIPNGVVGAPAREDGPRRKALFVGICYAGTESRLGGELLMKGW